jgi:hypothetical protein
MLERFEQLERYELNPNNELIRRLAFTPRFP